jgi:hypothetical protein
MTNEQSLQIVWDALQTFRTESIPEGDDYHDAMWSDICEAMAHLHETLDVEQSEID